MKTLLSLVIICLLAVSCNNSGKSDKDKNDTIPVNGKAGAVSPSDSLIEGMAVVNTVDIRILESFPVQVDLTVQCDLPDGCTKIGRIDQERNENIFYISVHTLRPAEAICTQAIVPFSKDITLDVAGLKKGTYQVDVNGWIGQFSLEADN